MATQAQIEANRKNAQKSTGPKTPAGKAVVAQNAVTHGLRANRFLLLSDDPDEFAEHRQSLLDELAPVGPMETYLANRIVALTWQLDRAVRFQSGSLNALTSDAKKGQSEEFILGESWDQDTKIYNEFALTHKEIYDAMGNKKKTAALQERINNMARRRKVSNIQRFGSIVRFEDMMLGRIAFKDFSQTRALERLLVYERRIENSLYKTQMQLERLQNLRRRRQAVELEKAMQTED